MAEFQRVAKERERMCETSKGCKECPLHYLTEGNFCGTKILNHAEESERVIMKWASEHPIKTNRQKFKDVFGFEFTDRVAESQYHREWLDAEYEGEQNG